MILVAKGRAPVKLATDSAALRAALSAEFDARPVAFRNNQRSFAFSDRVYSHSSVKIALERVQHGKCCYCEVVIPKAYSQQSRGAPKIYPGYYWLAYEWDNLFLSCSFCNSRNKRNLFPLKTLLCAPL